MSTIIQVAYLIAAFFFAFGLKMMSSPSTARRGNFFSALGMLLTIIVTLLHQEIVQYQWILMGMVLGLVLGTTAALRVPLTSMPELVAVFNGLGGLASLLVGWEAHNQQQLQLSWFLSSTISLTILIGGLTFSGSMLAWVKLKGVKVSGFELSRPLRFSGQQILNVLFLIGILFLGISFCFEPQGNQWLLLGLIGGALLLGVTVVMPIGGADMPIVISLLNSYSGLAACTVGFVMLNNILIVAGALVGASGLILTNIMCKAMNRSLSNVLFSGFGSIVVKESKLTQGEIRPISATDAYLVIEAAQSVIFVPGYGLAVAQAQHGVRELGELLESNGCEVRYAIHPVAGRMPGHMNVLLAEANVPYDQFVEIEDVNPKMEMVDVCIVIGANDVVNPAARDDSLSPIYGMPIIEVDRSKVVIILKRSMAKGFAGIDNPLFHRHNSRMLFGDAKNSIQAMIAEFKRL